MRTRIDFRHAAQRGQALILWVVLLVLFVVFIGIIAYVCIQTIKKIVPQPPPGTHWLPPHSGDIYDGGIITDEYYTYPSNNPSVHPQFYGATTTNILIYASPSPFGPWTDLIWSGTIDQVGAAMASNGLPIENFGTNPVPSARFYNIEVWFQ